jgi:methyl-accepting chemotaxis protein
MEAQLEEAQRLANYLRGELERQRAINAELRSAVAELARAFQETLARANDAAEEGNIERVRRITYENRAAWQQYLQQIVRAATTPAPSTEQEP